MSAAAQLPMRVIDAQPEKSVASHLKCNSCNRALANAFQTPHGCRLCQACYNRLPTESGTVRCPGNSEACTDEDEEIDINQGMCLADNATRREIVKIMVHCPNQKSGCGHRSKWRDMDKHMDECDYAIVKCDQCKEPIVNKNMQQHKRKECPKRLEQCSKCGKNILFSKLHKEHKDLSSSDCCEKFSGPCPYGCGQQDLSKATLPKHLSQACPSKPCYFHQLGCSARLIPDKLKQHYKTCAWQHFELICAYVNELTSAYDGQSFPSAQHDGSYTSLPVTHSDMNRLGNQIRANTAVSEQEVKRCSDNVMNVYEAFKRLQTGILPYAIITDDLDQMMQSLGGAGNMRSILKKSNDILQNSDTTQSPTAAAAGNDSAELTNVTNEIQRIKDFLQEIDSRIQSLENLNAEGLLMWKINNYSSRLTQQQPLTSPNFYSSRYGYTFDAVLSVESSAANQFSIIVNLVRGEYDDILSWPFQSDISVNLVCVADRAADIKQSVQINSGNWRPNGNTDVALITCSQPFKFTLQTLQSIGATDCLYVTINVA